MTKPTTSQTWVGVAMAALTLATTYLGYDKYEQVQAANSEPATVTVNVESMPDSAAGLSRFNIESLINSAIIAERERNASIYKKLEAWERN